MNGGIIDTGVTVTFGDAEGVIYTSSEGGINAAIAGTAGLTLFGPGTLALGADNSSTLSGTINVNAGTLVAAVDGATGPSGGATDIVNVNTGATLEVPVQGVVKSAVTIGQSGVLSLSGGTVAGTLDIYAIGQHSDAPGGILQGGGTISGTATIGGVIQCGPTVGLITFTGEEATILSESAFYWQLQRACDNSTSGLGPGIGWNALAFQSTTATIGSSDSPVRIFLDFSVLGGDPDSGTNVSFWKQSLTWTIATFSSGTTFNCEVAHGNFTYNSGCFCVCVQNSVVNLMWQPGQTSQYWCTPST